MWGKQNIKKTNPLFWGMVTHSRKQHYVVAVQTTDTSLLEGLKNSKESVKDYLNGLTLKDINQLVVILWKEYEEALEWVYDDQVELWHGCESYEESIKVGVEFHIKQTMPWVYLYGELPYFRGSCSHDYEEALYDYILFKHIARKWWQ